MARLKRYSDYKEDKNSGHDPSDLNEEEMDSIQCCGMSTMKEHKKVRQQ